MKILSPLKWLPLSIFILAVLSIVQSVSAQDPKNTINKEIPQNAAAWQQAASQDINDAYHITLDNHPGSYDPYNPDFIKNLKSAKEQAQTLIGKINNADGYLAVLMKFHTQLNDGHAGVYSELDPKLLSAKQWPGFVTVWRGDGLYVYNSEPGNIPAGAQVLACDDVPIKALIARNVFSYQGRIKEAGHWWIMARKVLEDRGNPFISPPKRCKFKHAEKIIEHNLVWQTRTKQATQWFQKSYNGDQLAVGLTEPRKNLFWVAMPTFTPDEQQRNSYRKLTHEVKNNHKTYLNADALVIDLRHNMGGSSQWSLHFAQALWGENSVNRRMNVYEEKTEVWWRASKANTDHITDYIDIFTREKRPEAAAWAKEHSEKMQAALSRGDIFYIESNVASNELPEKVNNTLAAEPPVFNQPLYVIVPGQCASACLDAIDVFSRFANTKLIGAPSAADSTYMEIRFQPLSSGLAHVIIPNKVYVNRLRGNGEIYSPDIFVNALEWSTSNFLAVIEKDLAKNKP